MEPNFGQSAMRCTSFPTLGDPVSTCGILSIKCSKGTRQRKREICNQLDKGLQNKFAMGFTASFVLYDPHTILRAIMLIH